MLTSHKLAARRRLLHFASVLLLFCACKSRSFNPASTSKNTPAELIPLGVWGTEPSVADEVGSSITAPDPEGLKEIKKAADSKFTRADVCADWELAIHFLALIQAPRGRSGANYTKEAYALLLNSCPGTYSTVAAELFKIQTKLRDYHTAISAPEIKNWYAPRVTKCSAEAVCGQTLNGVLLPLETSVGRHAYAMAWNVDKSPVFLDVLSVDEKPAARLFEDLVLSEDRSRQQNANAGQLASFLFLKRPLEEPSGEKNLRVKRVDTGEQAQITVSYDTTKSSPLPPGWNYFMNFAAHRADYGCDKVIEQSNDVIGACVLDGNRGLLWVKSFQVRPHDLFTLARKLLRENPEVTAQPILLDVRGNGGGDTEVASQLSCMVGGIEAANAMENTFYVGSKWPQFFELSNGTKISSKDLELAGNGDLAIAESGLVASSLSTKLLAREEFNISFLERFKKAGYKLNSKARCLDSYAPPFKDLRWVILTSGREFSAAETFLNFARRDKKRVAIVGRVSTGGTGSPINVTLPKTRMSFTVSQARQIDQRTGEWPIEGFGIHPDKVSEVDLPAEFERYLSVRLKGQVAKNDKSFRPLILREGLAFRGFLE